MRFGHLPGTFAALFLFFAATSCFAQKEYCRPCGPDSMPRFLRLLVPQGSAGADFKPACRKHDRCYGTCGADRAACDCQFLKDMLCQCQYSRNPCRCQRTAWMMYRAVRNRGENAFAKAQMAALSAGPSPTARVVKLTDLPQFTPSISYR